MNDPVPSPAQRLLSLRAELAKQGVDGLIVPRADEHLAEYVPAAAERLAWLTGFTGSAGLAVILPDRAAVFTDGRYTLQAAAQTDAALYEQHHMIEEPPPAWLAQHAVPDTRIGYDPWLISEDGLARYRDAGLTMVPLAQNPIDAIWTWPDRPMPPMEPALPHGLDLAGQSGAEKRGQLAESLRAQKQDAAVISDPASLAWLLNIRGTDVPFTPFALGFAVLHADARCDLFMDPAKVPPETRDWLGNQVSVAPRSDLAPALARLSGKRVRVDPAGSPAWFADALRAADATPVVGPDPCLLPKACKNQVEQDGAIAAHRRDAVAVCRFLHWLSETTGQTEMSAAAQLLAFRTEVPGFRGESFPAISGAGEHGAIIHYRVTPETDRPIRPDECYLIDSGAQYPDGTTDVTRTVWTGPNPAPAELRDQVTRVLRGHIALAALCFPEGVAGPHLDAFARSALWSTGLDYDHGTGHGVGSYLSVHEGPVSLSRAAKPVPLARGMILSNEPGCYRPGQYGIRLENLLLVMRAVLPDATKPFLCFRPLTLAPFDRRLIDADALLPPEREWLNSYHAQVRTEVAPHLDDAARDWLVAACEPL